MPEPADAVVALTTLATEEAAERLVRALLDRRLVACGTLLPAARSIYRWEGAVEDAREVVVLLKTVQARVPELRDAVSALHPYEVPELLVMPVVAGLPRYFGWLAAEVRAQPPVAEP